MFCCLGSDAPASHAPASLATHTMHRLSSNLNNTADTQVSLSRFSFISCQCACVCVVCVRLPRLLIFATCLASATPVVLFSAPAANPHVGFIFFLVCSTY
eukprot:Opistho-2@42010